MKNNLLKQIKKQDFNSWFYQKKERNELLESEIQNDLVNENKPEEEIDIPEEIQDPDNNDIEENSDGDNLGIGFDV
jgi:hypothetical protein